MGDLSPADVSQIVAPMEPHRHVTPISTWARRVVVGEDPRRGPLSPTPAQAAVLRAYETRRRIAVAGPVQDGKTLTCVVVPLLWQLAEDRRAVLLAGPSRDITDGLWTHKIKPAMMESGWADLLPESGRGSGGGVPPSITASTGAALHLRGAGGATESQQAMLTVRAVLVTEVDGIALSSRNARRAKTAGDEGRRKIDLLEARCVTYEGDGRIVLESTVKLDHQSLILSLVAAGSRGRMVHPWPCCGGMAPREDKHLQYDGTDETSVRATAHLVCPLCGVHVSPEDAAAVAWGAVDLHLGQKLIDGQVIGQPQAGTWSLRWLSVDSPLRDLRELAVLRWEAEKTLAETGDDSKIRQYTRDHGTAEYHEDVSIDSGIVRVNDRATLAHRSAASFYDRGQSPWPYEAIKSPLEGARAITLDIQLREIWWVVTQEDPHTDRLAFVDWGIEYLCHKHEHPTREQRKSVLSALEARLLHDYPNSACGLDVGGGGWLDEVDEWNQERGWAWWAMRGDIRTEAARHEGAHASHLPGWYSQHHRQDGRRLLVAADDAKVALLRGLSLPESHPSATLLPRGLGPDDHLARHLCGEERVRIPGGYSWRKRGASRVDLFDAGHYGKVLCRFLRMHRAAQAEADRYMEALTG